MPRIPVRTTPYHTLPRCTRHYKSKRDLILRALGKASFINGSQFVIAWISPKGEVDVYASELLQSAVSSKENGVLNRKELEREASRVRGEMGKRWEEIRRLEEKGEAPAFEDQVGDESMEADEDVDESEENVEADRTLVEEADVSMISTASRQMSTDSIKRPQTQSNMMSSFPAATRASTPSPPMHTLTLQTADVDEYYTTRFSALQQATCKLVVKAWIKVIEPKKQMKFPYNKGEDLKPAWWPEGVRHREPDHLSKTERLTLLASIVRSPLISVARLELSTAEAAAFISRPRLAILREVYLVAKEEEKRRKEGDESSEMLVHLPTAPVSPSALSPEGSEKRAHSQMDPALLSGYDGKENMGPLSHMAMYDQHTHKRVKHAPRLGALTTTAAYDNSLMPQPYAYSHIPQWRDSLAAPSAHLSPYPHSGSEMAWSNAGSDYSRSPNPDGDLSAAAAAAAANGQVMVSSSGQKYHPHHLAPILNPNHHGAASANGSHAPSPVESPAFGHPASMPNSAASYYARGGSYMQQQQMDYLQAHGTATYDYGSPYLTDAQWETSFTQAA